MSAAFGGPAVADWGPKSIRIYTAGEDVPRLVATIRAVDLGSVDELLRAYGWRRLGAWQRSDDMPADHVVAAIERRSSDDPVIAALGRDQEHGRQRRRRLE